MQQAPRFGVDRVVTGTLLSFVCSRPQADRFLVDDAHAVPAARSGIHQPPGLADPSASATVSCGRPRLVSV